MSEAIVPSVAAAAPSFGVLLPSGQSGPPMREVSADVALVFLVLRDPGLLPPPLAFASQKRRYDEVARLLLDGVLEIETGGGFLGGLEGCAQLGITPVTAVQGGRIAQLSREGLRYGAALAFRDPARLARKLYAYNRCPPGPRAPHVNGVTGTLDFLGLANGQTRARIDRGWMISSADAAWLVFTRRGTYKASARSPCKMYVSPRAEAMPSLLGDVADALFATGADQFKVGLGDAGLLRPDKLVAYFPSRDDLLAANERMCTVVVGVPPHGVPFSSGLDGAGVLSWGVDPVGLGRSGAVSWRQWITAVLAAALIGDDDGATAVEDRCTRALTRLRLEGVDADTFAPTSEWSGWVPA